MVPDERRELSENVNRKFVKEMTFEKSLHVDGDVLLNRTDERVDVVVRSFGEDRASVGNVDSLHDDGGTN